MLNKCLMVLLVFSLLLLTSCSKYTPTDLSCPDCNLIIINVELLRADFVGLLNNETTNYTPNIDAFFNKSIIFEDAFAPAGATYESLTSVFRGQEALEREYHTIADYYSEPNAPLTLAQVLKKNSWRTAYIDEGRDSGENVGMNVGFEDYYNIDNFALFDSSYYLIQKKLDLLTIKNDFPKFYLHYHSNGLHPPFHFTNSSNLSSYDFSKLNYSTVGSFMNYFYVQTFFDDGINLKVSNPKEDEGGYYVNAFYYNGSNLTKTRKVYIEKVVNETTYWYGSKLKTVDNNLGLVFAKLNELGLINNSIIILYANHGISFGEEGLFHHGDIYPETIHVPLLIKHPYINKTIIINNSVSLVDLDQTIYSILGVKHKTSGYDLSPLILGGDYDRDYIYGRTKFSYYIIDGNWEYIYYGPTFEQLINLSDNSLISKDYFQEEHLIGMKLKTALMDAILKYD